MTVTGTGAPISADERLAIEGRSLAVAQWSMLVFAVAGAVTAVLSGASALVLAALYSLISFFTARIAGRIVRSVRRGADPQNPLGRGGQESLYVLFRSLILIGIIGAAVLEAAVELVTYLTTGEGTVPDFGIVAVYCLLSATGCLSLAAYHRRNLAKVGGQSSILPVEATAARNDGLIDASIAIALGIVAFIPQGTFLTSSTFNVDYVADSIVVLLLGSVLLREPIGLVREQVRRLSGARVDSAFEAQVRAETEAIITAAGVGEFSVVDVYAVDHGGSRTAGICVTYPGSRTLDELDALREAARAALGARFPGMTVAIDFTRVPWHLQVAGR